MMIDTWHRILVGKCFVEVVNVGDRLRSLDPEKVALLAESIAAIGLQQPISIWSPDDFTLDLVAGRHRLEAVKTLGWEEITCVFVDMDELDRQLWEIDENLMRADLTAMERDQHTAKRKEVWEQRQAIKAKEAANQVGQIGPAEVGYKKPPKQKKAFAADTAKKTGQTKRATNKAIARQKNIPKDVQKEIAGTTIEDSGVQLDALAKATPEEQREAVKAVNLGHVKDVREVLPGAEEHQEKRERSNRQRAWAANRAVDLRAEMKAEGVAGEAVAREIAAIFVNKLSADEVDKVYEALDHPGLTTWTLREAIVDAGGGGRP